MQCSVGTESELINKGGRMNEYVNLAKKIILPHFQLRRFQAIFWLRMFNGEKNEGHLMSNS